MLLRDSLGHVNCHTTVIAEVTESLAHLQETLSTIQMASRIRRTQKRTKVLYMHASNILQSGQTSISELGKNVRAIYVLFW